MKRAAGTITSRESEVADSYHGLLRATPERGRTTHSKLTEGHRHYRLMFQDRPLCNVLRPRFITESREAELSRISGVLARVLETAGNLLLESDAALDLVGASEAERELWSIDPGYPGFTLSSRLDSFMVGMIPRFVEYNAESPAGIGFTDCLTEIFEQLPVMVEWEHRSHIRRYHGRQHLLDTLLWAYRTWGGKGIPSIAVIDWQHVVTKRDFELCAEYFREHGIPTHLIDPRALTYREGGLWAGNEPITLVYRRVLLHELLDKADEAADLLQAYRDGAVCMVNSPRSKLLHKKALFALLSDRQLGLQLDEEEQSVVDAAIPWTRLLRTGQTTHLGQSLDMVQFVRSAQDRLVLKPVDDYAGRGVVLGWQISAAEWEDAIEDALEKSFVVQERVRIPESEFPIWDGEQVTLASMKLDTSPLLFRGELGSVLTRISGSALLNVSAGTGSTTPTFAVMEN